MNLFQEHTRDYITLSISYSPITKSLIVEKHLFREAFEPSTPSFRALNTTFESRVRAQKNIFFSGVTARETTRSYYGNIKAIASSLSHVYAHSNIDLLSCSADAIQAQQGFLNWENESPSTKIANKIQAKFNITLQGILCGYLVESKFGDITANDCTLASVLANNNISLNDTSACHVVSNTDNIRINESPQNIQNVHAYNDIDIQSSCVSGMTKAVNGKVSASNASLNIVKACKDIILIDSPANTCSSSEGSIIVTATKEPRTIYTDLYAHKQISIIHVVVKKTVKSYTESVVAENSQLHTVIGTKNIELINCTANKIVLNVQRGSINTLALTKSTIDGNVSIKLIKESYSDLLTEALHVNRKTSVIIRGGTIQGDIILDDPEYIELLQLS